MAAEGSTLAERFVEHAGFCDRAGAPLYRELLLGLADDLLAGGVSVQILAGWESSSTGEVVQLRLLASLHRLVLTGRAPALEPFYRSVGTADPADPATAWPVAREVLAEQADLVRAGLDLVPQTNETGRSASLAVGLAALAGSVRLAAAGQGADRVPVRIRLLELGSSAGLNLLVDRFRIEGVWAGRPWDWGPSDSPLRLTGALTDEGAGSQLRPGRVQLVERAGCDLRPVDPLGEEGRLHLRSYVWPDHVERMVRLDAALRVAEQAGPGAAPVQRGRAAQWLQNRLSSAPEPGVVTVVWHSVVMQYLPEPERHAIDEEVARARRRMPVARLCLESAVAPYTAAPLVWLDGRPIAVASAHGLPVRLGAAPENPLG